MKTKDCCSQSELLQRCISSLLFLIAGVLVFQSAQAQTLIDADNTAKTAAGTYNATGNVRLTLDSIFVAHNFGTITGTGVTLKVVGFGTHRR
jgi:hypothetical protein